MLNEELWTGRVARALAGNEPEERLYLSTALGRKSTTKRAHTFEFPRGYFFVSATREQWEVEIL